jgi:hypothetical protein
MPVTVPVEPMDRTPNPLLTALIPVELPETSAMERVSPVPPPALVAFTPRAVVPVTVPVAVIDIVPGPVAVIPSKKPETVAAEIVMPSGAVLKAEIPLLEREVTIPFVVIVTKPLVVLLTAMPVNWPVMVERLASVKLVPPELPMEMACPEVVSTPNRGAVVTITGLPVIACVVVCCPESVTFVAA